MACNQRLVNQLMPHGSFVINVQFAGVFLGVAFGFFLASFRRGTADRASWGGLFVAAASTLLLAVQPLLVDLSLWFSSSLTTVTFLLGVRAMLLMAVALPFGIALAWIADSTDGESVPRFVAWGTPFSVGLGVALFLLAGKIGLTPLMAICGGLLSIGACCLRIR